MPGLVGLEVLGIEWLPAGEVGEFETHHRGGCLALFENIGKLVRCEFRVRREHLDPLFRLGQRVQIDERILGSVGIRELGHVGDLSDLLKLQYSRNLEGTKWSLLLDRDRPRLWVELRQRLSLFQQQPSENSTENQESSEQRCVGEDRQREGDREHDKPDRQGDAIRPIAVENFELGTIDDAVLHR